MSDNIDVTPGTGRKVASDQVTYSGDQADVQLTREVGVTGAEGSKTVVPLPNDATFGRGVDVLRSVNGALLGATNEAAAASDTATSGLNGLFKRLLQGITTLIAKFPVAFPGALGSGGGVKVDIVSGAGSGGTASNFAAAVPSAGTAMGASDGVNMQAPRAFDADSGGGTQYVLGANLRLSGSGGSVEGGTASNPIRTDPTGSTTQPVSAASLPLPSGAATSANQSSEITQSTAINTVLGAKTDAKSTATDGTSISAMQVLKQISNSVQLADGTSFLASVIQPVPTALTADTSASAVAAAGSGVRNFVTDVDVINTSGTCTQLILRDGSGGTVIGRLPVGTKGVVKSYSTPRRGTANTAVFCEAVAGAATVSLGGFTAA